MNDLRSFRLNDFKNKIDPFLNNFIYSNPSDQLIYFKKNTLNFNIKSRKNMIQAITSHTGLSYFFQNFNQVIDNNRTSLSISLRNEKINKLMREVEQEKLESKELENPQKKNNKKKKKNKSDKNVNDNSKKEIEASSINKVFSYKFLLFQEIFPDSEQIVLDFKKSK